MNNDKVEDGMFVFPDLFPSYFIIAVPPELKKISELQKRKFIKFTKNIFKDPEGTLKFYSRHFFTFPLKLIGSLRAGLYILPF